MAESADLMRRLTQSSVSVRAAASAEVVEALRRYQKLDRTYTMINAVLRGQRSQGDLSDEDAEIVRKVVVALDDLVGRWRTSEPIVVHRGLRSVHLAVGGVSTGTVLESRSFLSTTVHRHVAIDEFTRPPGSGGPALLEIAVPMGTPALWVPPLGDPMLGYQGELILGRNTRLVVRGDHDQAGIVVVDCEVLA